MGCFPLLSAGDEAFRALVSCQSFVAPGVVVGWDGQSSLNDLVCRWSQSGLLIRLQGITEVILEASTSNQNARGTASLDNSNPTEEVGSAVKATGVISAVNWSSHPHQHVHVHSFLDKSVCVLAIHRWDCRPHTPALQQADDDERGSLVQW